MQVIKNFFNQVFNLFPSLGLIVIFILISVIFWHTHKIGKLDWSKVITHAGNDEVSLSKCLQLVGGITGTWMCIYLTLHDKMTYDILLVYLGYVGCVDGYSKFLNAKYNLGIKDQTDSKNK